LRGLGSEATWIEFDGDTTATAGILIPSGSCFIRDISFLQHQNVPVIHMDTSVFDVRLIDLYMESTGDV
jgi:hypothetical protein